MAFSLVCGSSFTPPSRTISYSASQGPTAFGRIPGFTEHIFPDDSRPFLSLVANIGLCLFLFIVGLEIDSAVIKRNARLSVTVATAGMVLPFGMSCFPCLWRTYELTSA